MVPMMAIPMVPPKLRNKVFVAVATPSIEGATAFCTVRVNTGIDSPNPTPKIIMLTTAVAMLLIKAINIMATTMNGIPIRA
ncbi:hypothetical protein D3C81_1890480 [compost metagenome]